MTRTFGILSCKFLLANCSKLVAGHVNIYKHALNFEFAIPTLELKHLKLKIMLKAIKIRHYAPPNPTSIGDTPFKLHFVCFSGEGVLKLVGF